MPHRAHYSVCKLITWQLVMQDHCQMLSLSSISRISIVANRMYEYWHTLTLKVGYTFMQWASSINRLCSYHMS